MGPMYENIYWFPLCSHTEKFVHANTAPPPIKICLTTSNLEPLMIMQSVKLREMSNLEGRQHPDAFVPMKGYINPGNG